MSSCAIIRCATFGEPEKLLAAALKPVFGDNLIVARNGPESEEPHGLAKEVVLTEQLLTELGLHPVDKWPWKCGDYALIASANAFPEFDHYWMIEPDVRFNFREIERFFAKCDEDNSDFLCASFRRANPSWPNYQSASWFFDEVWSCFFPVTRLSRRALEAVHERRRAYIGEWAAQNRKPTEFANDEAFVASCVAAAGLKMESLAELAPERFPKDWRSFSFRRTILADNVGAEGPYVLHPVLEWDAYLRRVKRVFNKAALPFVGEVAETIASRGDAAAAKWLSNASHRLISKIAGGPSPDQENIDTLCRSHLIIGQKRRAERLVASANDFLLGPAHIVEKIDFRRMAPYATEFEQEFVAFVDTSREQVLNDPLLHQSQFEKAIAFCRAPLAAMPEAFLSEDGAGATFVFSIGRCGSAPAAALARAAGVTVITECDALAGFPANPRDRANAIRLMRCALASLRAHSGGASEMLIRVRPETNSDVEAFLEAFPEARFTFIGWSLEPWAEAHVDECDWDAGQMLETLRGGTWALRTLKRKGRLASFVRHEDMVGAPGAAMFPLLGRRDGIPGNRALKAEVRRDKRGGGRRANPEVAKARLVDLRDRLTPLADQFSEELDELVGAGREKSLLARLAAALRDL